MTKHLAVGPSRRADVRSSFCHASAQSQGGLITLGWPEFVALGVGLCIVTGVLATLLERDIFEALYRLEVRQYEQKLGFEVGLVKFPAGPPAGTWAIASVTPGGTMDQCGMRAGDVVVHAHGYNFKELSRAISEAMKGRTACVLVINAEEPRTGISRRVCLRVTTRN